MMFANLVAMICVNPAGFRIVDDLKQTEAETTGLAVAMAETTGIAGVAVVGMMAVGMTAGEGDEMTGHLAAAGIWDVDEISEVLDADELSNLPGKWLRGRSMESSNFIQGDTVSCVIPKETMRRKTPTRLSPARLLKNTSCDKVS
jgi:hypothetical protein